MKLREKRELEMQELKERRLKEKQELQKELEDKLSSETIEVLEIKECDEGWSYKVEIAFILESFRQVDTFFWNEDESMNKFISKVKRRIDYIKELREQYPEYCKQNDFIQFNSKFNKKITLTHMGYDRDYFINIQLADYLKLPNTTDCSFGGGDYEIKRTPKRVAEYNRNIDITIDALLDCITELRQRKYTAERID